MRVFFRHLNSVSRRLTLVFGCAQAAGVGATRRRMHHRAVLRDVSARVRVWRSTCFGNRFRARTCVGDRFVCVRARFSV